MILKKCFKRIVKSCSMKKSYISNWVNLGQMSMKSMQITYFQKILVKYLYFRNSKKIGGGHSLFNMR